MRNLLFLTLFLITGLAQAQPFTNNDRFTIGAIRVEGLQRIAEGTIFTYMPLEVGDTASASTIRSAIRALYRTGFFSDVSFARDNDILVIPVSYTHLTLPTMMSV